MKKDAVVGVGGPKPTVDAPIIAVSVTPPKDPPSAVQQLLAPGKDGLEALQPLPKEADSSKEVEFIACVKRAIDAPLGLDLRHEGDHLTIASVHIGKAASMYNDSVSAEKRILEGDIVVAVNGVSGSDQKMIESIRHVTEVKFLIRRSDAVS
eukprot:CAMPEP_0178432178 /NCGR_PEP_ID=MMETSP0689_2-20121128/32247_1 /TAXON_ID=160604 /ORGANISM="Amphidinium massartii, Strain CS-259" /LENGTH=151 /DNA_ID=CAMNT_0020054149 /DNA_START=109 /DNA_END=564 /DNA_ORIENTATION=+